jgi:hypothetical protein
MGFWEDALLLVSSKSDPVICSQKCRIVFGRKCLADVAECKDEEGCFDTEITGRAEAHDGS